MRTAKLVQATRAKKYKLYKRYANNFCDKIIEMIRFDFSISS